MLKSIKIARTFILFLAVINSVNYSLAQPNFTLYNLDNIVQSQNENPAFRSSAKFGVSFILFINHNSINLLNSGFGISDVFETRSFDDSINLIIENAIKGLSPTNYIDLNLNSELFGFNYTGKRVSLNFIVNNRIASSIAYPKDLVQFLVYGNGSDETIGRRLELDQIGMNLNWFMEYGFGLNRKFGNYLTVGAKLKYLVGITGINSLDNKFGIYTDSETFNVVLDGVAKLNLANMEYLYENDINFNSNTIISSLKDRKNSGYGIDLGFNYQSDKWQFSGSLIDWSIINWRNKVINYKINSFEFKYTGIDLNQYFIDSTESINKIIDSVEAITSTTISHQSFRTSIPTKIYLSGQYQLNKSWKIGVNWYNGINQLSYITGMNLSVNCQIKHWLSFSSSYSWYNYGNSNIGIGVNLRLGTLQLFWLTNSLQSIFNPESNRRFDMSAGISFQIDKTPKYR